MGKTVPKALSHISSLKHVIDIQLERSPDADTRPGAKAGARFACPITGQAMSGKSKFVVVRGSGHVLSERALKEVRLWAGGRAGGRLGRGLGVCLVYFWWFRTIALPLPCCLTRKVC